MKVGRMNRLQMVQGRSNKHLYTKDLNLLSLLCIRDPKAQHMQNQIVEIVRQDNQDKKRMVMINWGVVSPI